MKTQPKSGFQIIEFVDSLDDKQKEKLLKVLRPMRQVITSGKFKRQMNQSKGLES